MAGKTAGGGIPEERVWLMTVITFNLTVFVRQCEVSVVMVKGFFVQDNYAGIAPRVLGVTGGTIRAARFRVQTVKPQSTGLVRTDLLVTIDTQAILAFLRKGDMTS
jgi:hypothetical protein